MTTCDSPSTGEHFEIPLIGSVDFIFGTALEKALENNPEQKESYIATLSSLGEGSKTLSRGKRTFIIPPFSKMKEKINSNTEFSSDIYLPYLILCKVLLNKKLTERERNFKFFCTDFDSIKEILQEDSSFLPLIQLIDNIQQQVSSSIRNTRNPQNNFLKFSFEETLIFLERKSHDQPISKSAIGGLLGRIGNFDESEKIKLLGILLGNDALIKESSWDKRSYDSLIRIITSISSSPEIKIQKTSFISIVDFVKSQNYLIEKLSQQTQKNTFGFAVLQSVESEASYAAIINILQGKNKNNH